MKDQLLTISETLKYARHDFMNQLQLIRMNLDLGRLDEAKKVIENYSDDARKLFELTKIELPKTSDWLQTVSWRYPALPTKIQCTNANPIHEKFDVAIVELLEKVFFKVNERIDPFHDYKIEIEIDSTVDDFNFGIKLTGELNRMINEKLMDEHGLLKTSNEFYSPTEWQFSIKAR